MNSASNKNNVSRGRGFPFGTQAKRRPVKKAAKQAVKNHSNLKPNSDGYSDSDFSLFRDSYTGKRAQDAAFHKQSSRYSRSPSKSTTTQSRSSRSASVMPSSKPKPKPRRSINARQRRARRVSAFFLVIILLVGGVVVSSNLLLKIEGFMVEGESIYSQEELEQVFGVKAGTSIFGFDKQKREELMETSLPYLENVKIRRKLPGIVLFEITPATESYYAAQGEQCLVFSPTLKTLRVCDETPAELIEIVGFENAEAALGVSVKPADEVQGDILNTLINHTKDLPMGSISKLDVQDAASLAFVWQGRIVVKIGNKANLVQKINYALLVLQDDSQNRMTGSERGTLDVSQYPESPQVVFTPEPG